MKLYTNVQAAKKLGITAMSLGRYIKASKVPAPKILEAGGKKLHGWTEQEIEGVRKLLPKIANGRKTRYQKQLKDKNKTQPRAAVPHDPRQRKPKRTKKK